MKQITRRKLVKTNKGALATRDRHSASAIAAESRSRNSANGAIPSLRTKDVIILPPVFSTAPPFYLSLSLPSPSPTAVILFRATFLRPSRETLCLQDKQESFARKSVVVEVEGPAFGRRRNFNYGNITWELPRK